MDVNKKLDAIQESLGIKPKDELEEMAPAPKPVKLKGVTDSDVKDWSKAFHGIASNSGEVNGAMKKASAWLNSHGKDDIDQKKERAIREMIQASDDYGYWMYTRAMELGRILR